jgi:hypothetical protein
VPAETLTEADENRARVVAGNYMPVVMSCLSDPDTVPFAVPVLYNIMVDYGEPGSTSLAADQRSTPGNTDTST